MKPLGGSPAHLRPSDSNLQKGGLRFRWWMPSLGVFAVAVGLFVNVASSDADVGLLEGTAGWWVLTSAMHLPYIVILFFLAGGLVERIGFYWRGRAPEPGGQLPLEYPSVCVQLPMFNEHAVASRVIEAASSMTWPIDRLSVQVLDDSTDEETKSMVDEVCSRIRMATGVDCYVRRRADRRGYKAGALEEGRQETDAEFLVIFDAGFVPPQDFLLRTIPHFFLANGEADEGLALVQAQWGHLNHDESSLTLAQSLWVDDHHTLQMSWRSAMWRFVNFTGTAGVWRAAAIEVAGGWRAASLVEDCELSFRVLFAGFRTKFVKEVVVPAELPATYSAYKVQQRRWTQGWVQLQRLHLTTLLFRYRSSWLRRIQFVYHMCISWQWLAWATWITMLPFMIFTGHWFGSLSLAVGAFFYLLPTALFAVVAVTIATLETKHTYPGAMTPTAFLKRLRRIIPYLIINTGMLPHQFSAFTEGLFGRMHSEFERTPKAASVTTTSTSGGGAQLARKQRTQKTESVKIHWPYVLTEALYVGFQLAWAVLMAANGLLFAAVGAGYLALCVVYVGFFYGEDGGKAFPPFFRRFWWLDDHPNLRFVRTSATDNRTAA